MKIFISHSSVDKWAARRISKDLESLGAETFLDEKDIQTGESIDHSIKKSLKDSDDFLILLSPASIKSEWVLIELGGAFALEKNVIPILLYVGANEIPKIINLKLARDINQVDLYYNEITSKISGVAKAHKALTPKTKHKLAVKLKVGDKVKIISSNPGDLYNNDGMLHFNEEMEQYLGQTTTITSLKNKGGWINLSIDNGYWVWAEEWLIKID